MVEAELHLTREALAKVINGTLNPDSNKTVQVKYYWNEDGTEHIGISGIPGITEICDGDRMLLIVNVVSSEKDH